MNSADVLTERWAARHSGFTVRGRVLAGWLRLMWALARPFAAAQVSPDVVTVAGGVLAVAAARARPGRATSLLIGAALADGLDGAVAVLRDTTSAHGERLDHATDRVGDAAAALVLGRAGAPALLVAPALGVAVLQEAWRGWRVGIQRPSPVLTVHERPTRILCAAIGDTGRAVTGRRWPAVFAAVVWDVCAVIGVAQIVRSGRREAATWADLLDRPPGQPA